MTKLLTFIVASLGIILISTYSTISNAAPDPRATPRGFIGTTRDQLQTECKRIGVIPMARPAYTGVDPAASARIEAAATRALQVAGFDVVTSNTYANAFERYSREAGGVYDAYTGHLLKETYSKVYYSAARDLYAQDHIGCIVFLQVVPAKAVMNYQQADWDGAVEYVDGQANSGLYRYVMGAGGSGTLSALSISLKIISQQDRQIFASAGGVQLTNYIDNKYGNDTSNFLEVPRASLLLDDKRIDRAMNHATALLRYSTEELAAGRRNPAVNTEEMSPADLPMPPSGVSRKTTEVMQVPREQIFSTVHRIVLGPLLLNGYVPGPEVASGFRTMVHERLTKMGFEVTESDQINSAYSDAMRQVGGIYDPVTGKYFESRLSTVTQTALKSLQLAAAPDGIAFISLVRTTALQKYGNAAWDGAEQSGITLGSAVHRAMVFGGTEIAYAGEGSIAAVSLNFVLRDASGTVLYDARGGIQLDQVLHIKPETAYQKTTYVQQLVNLSQEKLFKDSARNEHAVDEALRELMTSTKPVVAEAGK